MSDHSEIRISKEVLDELPDEFEETLAGDPKNAKRQFRSKNIHAREYEDNYTVHIDRVDPRRAPLLHLALDSPETIGAALCTRGLLGRKGSSAQDSAERSHSTGSFLLSFLLLNSLLRSLKQLVRLLL